MTDFLKNATDLINRGFSLIPIEPRGKRPLTGWGTSRRTRDISDFAGVPADANVGICADENIVILESDDLARLVREISFIPPTLMSCGSSDNRPHLFFQKSEKVDGNLVAPGIFEARFVNQYVVGPGSVHPSGAVYRFLNDNPIAPLPDQLLSELVALAQSTKQRIRAIVKDGGSIPAGCRHDTRMHELGTSWDGKKTYEEMLALALDINARSNPPDDLAKIEREVRYIMEECEPNRPASKVTVKNNPVEPMRIGEPAVYDEEEMVYGIFPRGTVNILHGFSGVGKTRLLFELEDAARNGRTFMGYSGSPMNPVFILRDRLIKDYNRTLKKMGLPLDFVRLEELEPNFFDIDAVNKVAVYIDDYKRPPIVVVEGLDVMVTSTNNRSLMVKVLTELQNLAEHTGTAILGTWGAPKRQFNSRERYTNARAAASGCGELPRMANTMIMVEPITETTRRGGTKRTNRVKVEIDLRDGDPQEYRFKFTQPRGRLEPCEQIPVRVAPRLDDLSYAEMQEVMSSKSKFYQFKKGE